MPTNNETIAARAEAVIPGGLLSPSRRLGAPIAFARAEGPYLYDADGNRYTDYHCAFGANVLGHRPPAVAAAIAKTAENLDLIGAGVLELEVEVAELLVNAIPCADQVAFCSSGSEATYHALRLARAYTGRKQIIKFQGGYHGWHDYVAMNGQSSRQMLGSYDPMSDGMLFDAARHTAILPYNDAGAVEDYIRKNPGEVAAIIVEPIAHNMGAVIAETQFLSDLRRITAEHGVVLIFDEVITGFRHALGGYQSIVGVTPDLATFGKAATSGYPIGLVAGRREIMERVGRTGEGAVFMGGTFNGTPSSMAAVKATIEELARPGVYERLFELGAYLRSEIDGIIARHGLKAQAAGFGSVWLVYFFDGAFRDYTDLLRNDNDLDMRFRRALIAGRQVFQPLQLKRLYLSLSHDRAVLDDTLELIDTTMAGLARSVAA
ncbi:MULTISPECIES: aspartate aminotransferase family protein [unclassified Shinella]|uniref:aspartate aminotransferase family protein n=1 Tax=unclassified Shinella TaxID=2643062 RepID=UPI00234E99EF|nr:MULTISPECIES: aspartate aminotransferase family protein [unclassified Shinella]MCO5151485.1 aspartate aminotransferase family protein [Shinella sp.]MDC7266092.1 aspartate aminotransferase family protein [Shinella sp. HY16]MDC7272989.1 aspartate aminotransferase family protein [Shinella sp. YZ44]